VVYTTGARLNPCPDHLTIFLPFSQPNQPQVNGVSQQDPSEWQAIAALRERKIVELEDEIGSLKGRFAHIEFEYRVPSETVVKESAYYKALQSQYEALENAGASNANELARVREECSEMRAERTKYEEAVVVRLRLLFSQRAIP
jgi:chromosome segregation ATPase